MKILITGGCSGIGFDTAVRLALSKNMHYIYLAVHKKEQVKSTKERIKMHNLSNIEVIVIDITKGEDLLKQIENIKCQSIDLEKALKLNGGNKKSMYLESAKPNKRREEFYQDFNQLYYSQLIKK